MSTSKERTQGQFNDGLETIKTAIQQQYTNNLIMCRQSNDDLAIIQQPSTMV